MKKLLIAFVCMVLLSTTVMALETTVTVRELSGWEVFKMKYLEDSGEPLYISGGTLNPASTVTYGDSISAQMNVKFSKPATERDSEGYAYKLALSFVTEGDVPKIFYIGEYKLKTTHQAGDWIRVTVNNIDTGKIAKTACGMGVKIAGKHYVYLNGQWVIDSLSADMTNRYYILQRTTQNILLDCPDNNPCGTTTRDLGYVCYLGRRAMKQQTPYVQSDGTCKIGYSFVDCPQGYSCDNGDCKSVPVCSTGDKKCDLGGKVSRTCSANAWSTFEFCESGKCENGQCIIESQPGSEETSNKEGSNLEDELSSGDCVICTEDYKCPDGTTVMLECESGCYVDNGVECATVSGGKGTGSGTVGMSGGGIIPDPVVKFWENTTGKIIISVLAGLVVIIIGILIFMPKKKR